MLTLIGHRHMIGTASSFGSPFGWNGSAPSPNAAEIAARLVRLRRLAWLLDGATRIPGLRLRVGLNGLIGAAPFAGDLVMGAVSMLIVAEAYRLGVPRPILAQMVANVAIETAAGAVPVLGNLFDIAFKANLRNLALIESYFGRASI